MLAAAPGISNARQRSDDGSGRIVFRSLAFYLFVDVSGVVDQCRSEVCASKINGKDEI